ncbi:MAG: hypothetical protein AAGJ10_06145 [Bacteroidota bacterium]
MATYSPADFEGSPFTYGQRVKIHLYTQHGLLIRTITGTLAAREPDVNVARLPDAPPVYKTLYWVKELQGYERPHPDPTLAEAGQMEPIDESWFAEQDIEAIDERREDNPLLSGVKFN